MVVQVVTVKNNTILHTEQYSVSVKELKEQSIHVVDSYTESTFMETLIALLTVGMSPYGLSLYVRGMLDRKKELQKYCNRTGLPYWKLEDIIRPLPI